MEFFSLSVFLEVARKAVQSSKKRYSTCINSQHVGMFKRQGISCLISYEEPNCPYRIHPISSIFAKIIIGNVHFIKFIERFYRIMFYQLYINELVFVYSWQIYQHKTDVRVSDIFFNILKTSEVFIHAHQIILRYLLILWKFRIN